jgi:hypothetical protein
MTMRQQKRRPRKRRAQRLSRAEAAIYLGIYPPILFDWLVARRVLPKPKLIDGVEVWEIETLGKAWAKLLLWRGPGRPRSGG